jgi:large subunit ribosomal protein L22
LPFVSKGAARPLGKVIASAVANAKHNHQLNEKTLKFKSIVANEGPTLKRWRTVSRGRAHPILKRTSHIRVVLEGEEK